MPWDGRFYRVDEPKEIGAWCREMRKSTHVQAKDVGDAIGRPRNQVTTWERGDIIPSLANALEIVAAHGYQVYLVRKGTIRDRVQ
jgi:DNA-binding transcriptional regulator YiaG